MSTAANRGSSPSACLTLRSPSFTPSTISLGPPTSASSPSLLSTSPLLYSLSLPLPVPQPADVGGSLLHGLEFRPVLVSILLPAMTARDSFPDSLTRPRLCCAAVCCRLNSSFFRTERYARINITSTLTKAVYYYGAGCKVYSILYIVFSRIFNCCTGGSLQHITTLSNMFDVQLSAAV